MSLTFYPGHLGACGEPSLNVSNTNAYALLDALDLFGYDTGDGCGEASPAVILAAVERLERQPELIERVTRPDEIEHGVLLDEQGVGEGSTLVLCGLPAERFTEHYLPTMRRVALAAQQAGSMVVWS